MEISNPVNGNFKVTYPSGNVESVLITSKIKVKGGHKFENIFEGIVPIKDVKNLLNNTKLVFENAKGERFDYVVRIANGEYEVKDDFASVTLEVFNISYT